MLVASMHPNREINPPLPLEGILLATVRDILIALLKIRKPPVSLLKVGDKFGRLLNLNHLIVERHIRISGKISTDKGLSKKFWKNRKHKGANRCLSLYCARGKKKSMPPEYGSHKEVLRTIIVEESSETEPMISMTIFGSC